MNDQHVPAANQRGVALVTSLLLLVIITILALSMFRSFGTQERIAGNLREKERALHAADSAQQYAEWWLLQSNNTARRVPSPVPPGGGDPHRWDRSATDPDAAGINGITRTCHSLAG